MTVDPQLADPIVFDAEPLIAYALDERGSDRVDAYLEAAYDGTVDAFVNVLQLLEVHYVLSRVVDPEAVDAFVDHLDRIGVRRQTVDACWHRASRFKRTVNPSLGDAVALATAADVGGTLLAGADDDFDGVEAVTIERFRRIPD